MTKYPTCRFYNERKFDQLTLCLWNSTVWILLILIFMFLIATTHYRLVFYVDRKYKNKKNRDFEKHFTKIEVYSAGNSEPTHSYPHFMITNVRPCLTYNECKLYPSVSRKLLIFADFHDWDSTNRTLYLLIVSLYFNSESQSNKRGHSVSLCFNEADLLFCQIVQSTNLENSEDSSPTCEVIVD